MLPIALYPQESFLFIHEIKEGPFNGQEAKYEDQVIPGIAYELEQPLEKTFGGIFPIDDTARHVDEDGVHTDDAEEERPLFIPLNIDDIIEGSQQQQADTAYLQYKGAGPEVLINGKDEVPELCEDDEDHACQGHSRCLGGGLQGAMFQEVAGEDPQESRTDGRNGGYQPFRVMDTQVKFARDDGPIDIGGEITFHSQVSVVETRRGVEEQQ